MMTDAALVIGLGVLCAPVAYASIVAMNFSKKRGLPWSKSKWMA
jgi:hypothetical protein